MRKVLFSLILIFLFLYNPASAVTVMKSVGHGDCYLVLSDGRVVVIDAGPAGSSNGLISVLRSGLLHYDRIIITHVHSDHAGGLLTAEQYAAQNGAHLSTDLLVSNHGEYDLSLIINETRIRPLLQAMKGRKQVAALTDEGLAKLGLKDPNLEVKGIVLSSQAEGNENRTGLIIKVTEIRDGERRATLFLGDIEQQEQDLLFQHEQGDEIFADVHAVTLPHHGRPTTLSPKFFENVRQRTGEGTVLLHSDSKPILPEWSQRATDAGLVLRSTAESGAAGKDIIVSLFDSPSYTTVRGKPASLRSIVTSTRKRLPLVVSGEVSREEMANAVAAYSGREVSSPILPGTTISLPTDAWVRTYVETSRQAFRSESDAFIAQLRSHDEEVVKKAATALVARAKKLNSEQIEQVVIIMRGAPEVWVTDRGHPDYCPHKNIYDTRSTEYYAASVFANSGQAADIAVTKETQEALKRGKSTLIRDDPGWT